jgi:hypothetical protein
MQRVCICVVVILVLALCACVEDRYHVELELRPEAVQRSITMTARHADQEAERTVLATVYANASLVENRVVASGEFAGALPDDIGTFARASRFRSEFGELVIYLERVRGTDDWVGVRQLELEAVDAMADMVVAWARVAFAGKAGAAELVSFLDGPARRDAQNMGYLASLALSNAEGNRLGKPEQKPPHPELSEFIARALAYLASRQYLSLEDADVWGTVQSTEGNARATTEAVLKMFKRRLTADGKHDAAALLNPPESLATSFLAYTHAHPDVVRPWYERHGEDMPEDRSPEEREYEVSTAFEMLIYSAAGAFTAPRDELLLSFDHGGKVLATNGEVTGPGRIEWEYHIGSERGASMAPSATPLAIVVRPNAERQRAILGHPIAAEDVARYCLSLATLAPDQRGRWTALVEKHGKDLDALEQAAEEMGLHWTVHSQLIGSLRVPEEEPTAP